MTIPPQLSAAVALPVFAVEFARDRLLKPAYGPSTMGAQLYDAEGAAAVGYLDRVVPVADLVATATAEARRLAELRTGAYARTKTALRGPMIAATLAGLEADMADITAPPA